MREALTTPPQRDNLENQPSTRNVGCGDMSKNIRASVALVAEPWRGSPYYDTAEQWNHFFWGEGSPFRVQFQQLDLESVIELACGHGRRAKQIKPSAGKIYLMDVLSENIDFCRSRLADAANVEFIVGDGFSFRPVPDGDPAPSK